MASLPSFRRRFGDGEDAFTVIGGGALGGKASGLALIREQILGRLAAADMPEIAVGVPPLTVLSTDVFDRFLAENGLHALIAEAPPDERLALAFQQAALPAAFAGDLRALAELVHQPLALRSSSLLEDALRHPFAGVYGTKMIPGHQVDAAARFRQLAEGIKLVWASTFFSQARRYAARVGADPLSEKMAVVIQAVVGERHGERFYPTISGVARSHNHYPFGHGRAADGVVSLALGLGCQIVGGGRTWSYSPAYPASPQPFNNLGDLLGNTQTGFWAVNMGRAPLPDPLRETEYLLNDELEVAEADGQLGLTASTFDGESGHLRPGIAASGPRVLDFAPILRHGGLPLNDLLRRLLAISREVLAAEVEIEFALALDPKRRAPARFGFLQVRPMLVGGERVSVEDADFARPDLLLASETALGNGRVEGIRDIVYLKPEAFDTARTRQMAAELEVVNRRLTAEERPYLLIGFGRWGTSDEWLGVPVDWAQIGGARVIVEATLPDVAPDMSQGSHFFHNLISFEVKYLFVPHGASPAIAWEWLDARPAVAETAFLRWVRTESPLGIKVDGTSGKAVVIRDGREE